MATEKKEVVKERMRRYREKKKEKGLEIKAESAVSSLPRVEVIPPGMLEALERRVSSLEERLLPLASSVENRLLGLESSLDVSRGVGSLVKKVLSPHKESKVDAASLFASIVASKVVRVRGGV